MRIVHISDLHICGKFKRENTSKIIKLIKYALDKGADHFVFTGDISDNSNKNDYLIFRKILENYNIFSADKSTVIIGNHDIFGGVQTANDIVKFPSKCLKTDYLEKVKIFYESFSELFENSFFPDNENPFPFAKELDNILLVGLNSIDKYSKIKNPFASNGHVSKHQKANLQKIFSIDMFADKVKILLVHHHFFKDDSKAKSSESVLWNKIENYTMKLRGKKKLINLMKENNIKLVLHGHSHEFKEYNRKGIKFINAGASVDNQTDEEAGMFLVNIEGDDIKVSLELLHQYNKITSVIETGKVFFPSFAQ